MELIGIIVLVIIGFVVLGVGGWLLKLLGYVFDFPLEGFFKSIGCLFWVLIILLILFSIGS
jgi:hypothetical protein